MPKLAYEPLTEPTLTCEKVFSVQPIFSKKQIQKFYDQASISHVAIGHVISLDEEQIILLTSDEPEENPTVTQHLLEDLQFELGKLVKREPSADIVKRQQRLINKYDRIIDAIEALPETSDEIVDRDLIAEKLSC